jgi:hypothetical protein
MFAAGLTARLPSGVLTRTDILTGLDASVVMARESLDRLAARERILAEPTVRPPALQPGLFDARAIRHADARDRAAVRLAEETTVEVLRLETGAITTHIDIVGLHPVTTR